MVDGAAARWFIGSIQRGMRRTAAICCAGLVAGGLTAAHTADIELGRHLSAECMTCHSGAKATDTIPNIIGMADTTFAEVVKAYRDKRLPNPVMQNIASRLNDEEIAALAAFFATAKKQTKKSK